MHIEVTEMSFVPTNKSHMLFFLAEVAVASLEYEETTCKPMSIKEIYTATESLSPSNIIGQGIAGTCP